MDIVDTVVVEIKNHDNFDKFAKMLLGSCAGFVTSKFAEKVYDKAITAYRAKK